MTTQNTPAQDLNNIAHQFSESAIKYRAIAEHLKETADSFRRIGESGNADICVNDAAVALLEADTSDRISASYYERARVARQKEAKGG